MVESLLDARMLPVRVAILLGLAVGCLLLLTEDPSAVDWATGIAAVLVTAFGVRAPFATALATSGLLALGFAIGDSGPVVAKVAAAFALTELTARRGSRFAAPAAAVLFGVYLLHPAGGTVVMLYRAAVMATVPVLFGLLLRTAWTDARRAARAAADLAEHREQQIAAATVAERTAIARELHDLVAHHVSSTVLRVGAARHAFTDAPPALLQVLEDVDITSREALADLRKLVTVLRTPEPPHESFVTPAVLTQALDEVIERARRTGLDITTHIDDSITDVDPVSALTLLRLTQEALANVAAHAGPRAVAQLRVAANRAVEFEVRDSGGVVTATSSTGLGLVGLRERLAILGGTLEAGPHGTGWRLAARWPLRAAT
ncbi:sensor histidine kinase [Nocardia sp. NPDC058518]|uniref:sensor histidine kinase n=1 Tax=Nocardia sp. NPDC058518 TaxID=3346534 RepID=UPI0036598BE0